MPKAPQQVLLDAVVRAVGDADILGAIFTTYSLDPAFFQDEVLCRLLRQESPMVRARRLLAREALGEVRPLVLYDASTVQSGQTVDGFRSDVPVHYQAVRHPNGAFHPKLCLILTGSTNPDAAPGHPPIRDGGWTPSRLVVVVSSANLTPQGWRRNLEVAWTGVVERGAPCPFRGDLLGEQEREGLLAKLGRWSGEPGAGVLAKMRAVVESSVEGSAALPRIWHGEERLDVFLASQLPAKEGPRTIELVAPFVSDPDTTPVERLIEGSKATRTRVRLPRNREAMGSASAAWVESVSKLPGVKWRDFPVGLTSVGKGQAQSKAAERFVHAKLLHAWDAGGAWLLSGSPNLTVRGHAGRQGETYNVEVAVLSEVEEGDHPWLEQKTPATGSDPCRPPEEEPKGPYSGAQLIADWEQRLLELRVHHDKRATVRLFAGADSRKPIASVTVTAEGLAQLKGRRADPILMHLEAHSVVWVQLPGFEREAVLVEERGLLKKPDALSRELTKADILSIWATLEPFRRQQLLEAALRRRSGNDDDEADVGGAGTQGPQPYNLFERQAGQFFAFHILQQRIRRCFDEDRPRRAEVLTFGEAGDSVRSLMKRLGDEQEPDPVDRLVLLLCCREVLELVRKHKPEMLERHHEVEKELHDRYEAAWQELGPRLPKPEALREWVAASWPGVSE